jgi:hypothetical protein
MAVTLAKALDLEQNLPAIGDSHHRARRGGSSARSRSPMKK